MQVNIDSVSRLQVHGDGDVVGQYEAKFSVAFADFEADFHGIHPASITPTMNSSTTERLHANSWMVVPSTTMTIGQVEAAVAQQDDNRIREIICAEIGL